MLSISLFCIYARAVERKLKGSCGESVCKIQPQCSCTDKPQMYFAMFSQHIGVPHFLSSGLVNSLVTSQKSPKKERQDSYPWK